MGSGRQKLHLPPFGIASTAVIFACPSHLPGTVTFDRYLETNVCPPRRHGNGDPMPSMGARMTQSGREKAIPPYFGL